jgi:tetratricopeptide (TPR) repeat protein
MKILLNYLRMYSLVIGFAIILGYGILLIILSDNFLALVTCTVPMLILAVIFTRLNQWSIHTGKGHLAIQQQRFADAEKEFRKGLECARRFADDDPRVGHLLDGLAQAQRGLGNYTEAESLAQQSFAVQEKAWGPDHYRTQVCANNLANVYLDLARFDDARALYHQALRVVQARRGSQHPDFAICLNNMAKSYSDSERYADAEPFFRQATEIVEARLKPNHWCVGLLFSNMAYVLGRQGKCPEAETYAERALSIFEHDGKHELLQALALANLGHVRYRQGRFDEAEDLLQQSYSTQKKLLARTHPQLVGVLHDLARVFAAQKRWTEAEEVCQRELHLCEEYLVPTHPLLARALENYAALLTQIERAHEAGHLLARARQVRASLAPHVPAAADNLQGPDTAIRAPQPQDKIRDLES